MQISVKMAGTLHWFLLGLCLRFILCSGQLCHLQPECRCSKSRNSYITCNSLYGPYIPKLARSDVRYYSLVIYGNRQITHIRDGTFEGLNLRQLEIQSTGITNIACDVLTGINTTLPYVRLEDNFLTVVPNCSLTRFPTLGFLSLSRNRITAVMKDTFVELSSLTTLLLDNNMISTVQPGAFSGLNKLMKLDLSGNDIVSLDASTFRGAQGLEIITLEDNSISILHTRTFDGLEKLNELRMQYNDISDLDETIFHSTPGLTDLDISNNKLTALSDTIFHSLVKLQRLYFGNNSISQLPESLFSGLTELLYLQVHDNGIESLPKNVFQSTRNLTQLLLSGNQIELLIPGTFQSLSKLTYLNINNNRLVEIGEEMFKGLLSLRRVYLSNNRLTVIQKDAFIDCPDIGYIYLRNNSIKDIRPGAFQHLVRLYDIDLGSNQLEQIVQGTFNNVSRLRSLVFDENRISFVDERSFSAEINLYTLDLRNNNMSSVAWTWLEKLLVNWTRLENLYLSHNPLHVIPPNALELLKDIGRVDMINCSVEIVTNKSVNIFPGNIDMSSNLLHGFTSIHADEQFSRYRVNVSNNMITSLNISTTKNIYAFHPLTVLADNNRISNMSMDISNTRFWRNVISISLKHNTLDGPIRIYLQSEQTTHLRAFSVDFSNNNFARITIFPIQLFTNISQTLLDPCKMRIYVNNVNLSSNAISYISPEACLGIVRYLDLRNNRLDVLGQLMPTSDSAGFRMLELDLSGNRIHKITPDFRLILAQRDLRKLSLSGNPLNCGCGIAWLRNDSIINKLDSFRCHSPPNVGRYLAWCFPLDGCPPIWKIPVTDVTMQSCESDSSIEVSNLTVSVINDMANITWTKAGPGRLSAFRLERQHVDQVDSGVFTLIHPQERSLVLTNLEPNQIYTVCVSAVLDSSTVSSVVCVQTPSLQQEDFCAGLELFIGLVSGLGFCVLILISCIIGLMCGGITMNCCKSKNIANQHEPKSTDPVSLSQGPVRNRNIYQPTRELPVPPPGEDKVYEDLEEREERGYEMPGPS